jgi:hypothetical protein
MTSAPFILGIVPTRGYAMPAHHMPIWHFSNCDNARTTLTISVGADNIAATCEAAAHPPRRLSGGPTDTGQKSTSCPEVFLFGAIWLLTLRKEISAVSSI